MRVTLLPSDLKGIISAQPSKSDAHRKILCAVFAKGTSLISNVVLSEDIKATLRCADAIGASYYIYQNIESEDRVSIKIEGVGGKVPERINIDCGESGSTARFLTMILAASGAMSTLTGSGRLPLRPMDSAINFLMENGVSCIYPADKLYMPLTINGELESGDYSIDSSITSQYISGLLMALPSFSKCGLITASGNFESKGYVNITKNVLKNFSIEVSGNNPYSIPPNNGLKACNVQVEGDWSNISYFLVMKALGANIQVEGINKDSKQPDSVITKNIEIILNHKIPLIDVSECPDIMPSLAVLGAALKKTTKIVGGKRLRAKESDRIKSVAEGLRVLGVSVREFEDGMEITGSGFISGGIINAYNDHRIAMAFSALCVVSDGDIVIEEAESVAKSYPSFFEDIKKLGGKIK